MDQVAVDEGHYERLTNDAGEGRVTGPCGYQKPTTARPSCMHLFQLARTGGETVPADGRDPRLPTALPVPSPRRQLKAFFEALRVDG